MSDVPYFVSCFTVNGKSWSTDLPWKQKKQVHPKEFLYPEDKSNTSFRKFVHICQNTRCLSQNFHIECINSEAVTDVAGDK